MPGYNRATYYGYLSGPLLAFYPMYGHCSPVTILDDT